MLSYRHAFHAGNHADMLKHLILFLVMRYYRRKDNAFHYIDTHAGAGLYDLQDAFAQKVGEYQGGWQRLNSAATLPDLLAEFAEHVRGIVGDDAHYCGSPWLAASLLREQDKALLFELHPADFEHLRHNIGELKRGRQIRLQKDNGFQGLIAALPPASRRAVVLIDPPYEMAQDYKSVVKTLQDALKRFASGTYLLWYPLLSREESQGLAKHLRTLKPDNYLLAELSVETPRQDGFGMFGSGMFVINPPYVLAQQLNDVLPHLCTLLAQNHGANWHLEAEIA